MVTGLNPTVAEGVSPIRTLIGDEPILTNSLCVNCGWSKPHPYDVFV